MSLLNAGRTIAAIATPPGAGAVALLRVSGAQAREIVSSVWQGKEFTTPRLAQYGAILASDGSVLDQVLATWFRGPASYTGEDTVEIGCHGGVLVTQMLLARLLEAGAAAAEPGEFTRRAFLNRKLDLTQAEAVMDLISAQTGLALRAAQSQLAGGLGQRITALRDTLLEVLAHVEAYIDFPEEDISPDTGTALTGKLEAIVAGIDTLLATAGQGRILREGARTVLAGVPNAGKSSLLNRLLRWERAIVSDIPGTTRDTIEEVINLRGLPLRLVDTAGLREDSLDPLEAAGMARTLRQLETADLIIEVVDASLPPGERIERNEESGTRHLLVLNKADMPTHPGWSGIDGVPVSCLTGDGLTKLEDALFSLLSDGQMSTESSVNARHTACLKTARSSLAAAMDAIRSATGPEFTALDLREAMSALGEIVGHTDTEDLLGIIFSSFCIGK